MITEAEEVTTASQRMVCEQSVLELSEINLLGKMSFTWGLKSISDKLSRWILSVLILKTCNH